MGSEEEPVAWLRAAILERKAMALAAGDDDAARAWTGRDHGYEDGGEVHDGHDEQVVYDEGSPNTAQALHIALNDPQDTIARCEAELAILDEHGGEHMCFENTHDGNTWSWYIGDCRNMLRLASSYKHWPGYQEEDWKP